MNRMEVGLVAQNPHQNDLINRAHFIFEVLKFNNQRVYKVVKSRNVEFEEKQVLTQKELNDVLFDNLGVSVVYV